MLIHLFLPTNNNMKQKIIQLKGGKRVNFKGYTYLVVSAQAELMARSK